MHSRRKIRLFEGVVLINQKRHLTMSLLLFLTKRSTLLTNLKNQSTLKLYSKLKKLIFQLKSIILRFCNTKLQNIAIRNTPRGADIRNIEYDLAYPIEFLKVTSAQYNADITLFS